MSKVNIIYISDDVGDAQDAVKHLVGFIRKTISDEMEESFKIIENEDEGSFTIQSLYGNEIVIRALEPTCRPDYFAWMFWNAVEDEEEFKTNYKRIAKDIGFKESDWYERTIIDLGGVTCGTERVSLIKAVAAHNMDAPWMAYTDCEYNNHDLSILALDEQLKYHVTNFMLRNRPKPDKPAWESKGDMIDFGGLSCRIHNACKVPWGYDNYAEFLLRMVDIFLTVTVLPFRLEVESEGVTSNG